MHSGNRALIGLLLFILCCLPASGAPAEWTRLMDDGHGAEIIQDFMRAEIDYKKALRIAQESKDRKKEFYSMVHLLCAQVMLLKFAESEPLFQAVMRSGQRLKKDNEFDSDMVEEIDDLCDAYHTAKDLLDRIRKVNADEAVALYQHSLELRFEFLPYTQAEEECLLEVVEIRINQGRYNDAISVLEQFLNRTDKANVIARAKTEVTLSCIYEKMGNHSRAKALNDSARQEFAQAHDLGDFFGRKRWFFAQTGDSKQAIQNSISAIEEYKKPGCTPAALGLAYCLLAVDYRSQGKYVESEKTFKQTIAFCQAHHLTIQTIQAYEGLAATYRRMGRTHDAEQASRSALAAKSLVRALEKQDFHDISGDRNVPSSLRNLGK